MYTVYFDQEKFKECSDPTEVHRALNTLLPVMLAEMGMKVFDENGVEMGLRMIFKSGGMC